MRSPARRVVLASIAFALTLSASGIARADEEEEARNAMRRGVAAFGRGEADKALEEYELAKKLVPQANAPYLYAAEALVALARYEEAVANLDRYLAKNPSVSDAEDVRGRIAKIKAEHYPGRVKVATNVDDAVVYLDGEAKGAARVLDAKPGAHRIEARAPGRDPVTQEINVVGAQDTTVVLTLAESRVDPPPPLPTPLVVNDPGVPWKTIGWVTTGVGATTFLVALIVDGAALGPKIDDYRDAASRADPSARTLHDDAVGLRTLSVAGYVAGAVLTTAGLGMVLFSPKASRSSPSAASLSPWVGPSGAGVGLSGRL